MSQRTIAVDFDGPIHAYSAGWCEGDIYDPPAMSAKDGLKWLQGLGYRIVIYSCRGNSDGLARDMERWLRKYQMPFDEIWTRPGKPAAELYIDDRGFRWTGWGLGQRDEMQRILNAREDVK